MDYIKDISALLSIAITCVLMVPYLKGIKNGNIKPHFYTWFIWTLTTGIAGLARTADHAGPGAWAQWTGSLCCFWIACVSFRKGERKRTLSDQCALVIALLAIPIWVITKNPLLAIIMVTFIDVVGYLPTFRKSWSEPDKEAIFNYVAANIIHLLSLYATEHYSLTTVLFPVTLFWVNTTLIAYILIRRRFVNKQKLLQL